MSVIEARVQSTLVDLASFTNYCIDRFTDQAGNGNIQRNDRVTIADLPSMTVYSDGSVPRQAGARNDPTANELTLIVNQEPWIPVQIPFKKGFQSLAGQWASQVGRFGLIQLKNQMDSLVIDDYITGQLCWLASGVATYHFNVEGDGLEPKDFLKARGIALRQRGTMLSDLLAIMDSLGASALLGFPGWKAADAQNTLGAQTVGRIYGVEVVETQAVRLSRQFNIATLAITAGLITATFLAADAPGVVVGQLVRTFATQAGYDVIDPVQVQTVSADGLTVTFAGPAGAADDADIRGADVNLDKMITASACNVIVDRANIHQAQQRVPSSRVVPDPDTTGEILQLACLFGYIGRAGRGFVIHSPENDV